MERYVAPCGLLCSDCDSYNATKANDLEALQRVVEKWRVEYEAPDLTIATVACDGCLATAGRLCGNCYECDIRACALGRGYENCAQCADYSCAKTERFFGIAPRARAVLDELRAV
jgi:hypothetical protein